MSIRLTIKEEEGLLQAILKKFDINNKELVIVGAGNVATSLIDTIALRNIKPKKITIANRTYGKAKLLAEKLPNIDNILKLSELGNTSGDILINATELGGSATDDVFNEDIVSKYKGVVDVTFKTENTNLTTLAKKLNIVCSSGWDFFTFQGKVFLEDVLGIAINVEILKKYVYEGLKTNV
ncbi:NAD(P)-binding domain-containing protein [bacterium]|nr:NAD(P)-binding domain-containing protein [bacterium]